MNDVLREILVHRHAVDEPEDALSQFAIEKQPGFRTFFDCSVTHSPQRVRWTFDVAESRGDQYIRRQDDRQWKNVAATMKMSTTTGRQMGNPRRQGATLSGGRVSAGITASPSTLAKSGKAIPIAAVFA
jgi:hypothetical protein